MIKVRIQLTYRLIPYGIEIKASDQTDIAYVLGEGLARALCDCYKYCPLCSPPWTVPMSPFTPDSTNPATYRSEDRFGVKAQALEKAEWALETLYVCYNHTPPYYSSLKPVEVKLT